MVKIIKIKYIKAHILSIKFNDGTEKILDFENITTFDGIAEQLKDVHYFNRVSIFRNGRSFGWDNGYDCCADWAYNL